jgi:hypothetical protein
MKRQAEEREVEVIGLRLKVNEWEGMVQATRAHNTALVERV